mgnify:CR=1 FL=1
MWAASLRCLCAVVLSGFFLTGCLPPSHSQSDEEKEPHFLAGKSRASAMDYTGAIESFSKAVEVNPRSGAAHFELGWLYEQRQGDPAAAIYHYSKYLQFRPDARNAETIKTRIHGCKQELARTVSLGPVTQDMQKEFEHLALTNKFLQTEVEKWKSIAESLQAITNRFALAQPQSHSLPQSHSAGAVTPAPKPASSSLQTTTRTSKTHTVRAGETPTVIARKYGVRVDALLKANPRVDPRRMQVGEVLRIP